MLQLNLLAETSEMLAQQWGTEVATRQRQQATPTPHVTDDIMYSQNSPLYTII
jgi:hypothetical protein